MSSNTSPRLNRLAAEKSPYLQQHASNPVDWYPWGGEAFAAARAANKPIFLSIGYSTCHWCHVMAHESFESPEIAAVMNELYINIKVDREERPDVDAIYMTAVQAITGSGGWPMSVWLTPDLRPYYGGTYFPPEERWGRTGFPDVLRQLAEAFANDKERVADAAGQITDLLNHAASSGGSKGIALPKSAETDVLAFRSLEASFDSQTGGFTPAPKFPMPVYLEFLLDHHRRTGEPRALEMATLTFRHMAEGGLYDQLGGGFSRYSTDHHWLVPHFEKMLYDNAQLLRVAAGLYAATGDSLYRDIAMGTASYLFRDLRHKDGGFFSAEDADSEGKEGTFYLWTLADLRRILGDDTEFAAAVFGVTAAGNFMDPHTREAGQNVLSLFLPPAAGAAKTGVPAEQAAPLLGEIRQKLFDARAQRPRPHRDEKVLTEWNGLAISGLARAGFLLNEPSLVEAASHAADFIVSALYDPATATLYRRWYDGSRAIHGQLADYAMFIEGLLDLFEATGEPARLRLAIQLHRRQNELFFDASNGGYHTSVASPDLLVRMKEDGDNVIPSANATAVRNGLRLAALTGDKGFRESAVATLSFFAPALKSRPYTLSRMVPALAWAEGNLREVVIAGDSRSPGIEDLLGALRKSAVRDAVVILAGYGPRRQELAALIPSLETLPGADAVPMAYVCRNFTCQAPSSDSASFLRALSV